MQVGLLGFAVVYLVARLNHSGYYEIADGDTTVLSDK